jgi:hypothetical protein
MSLIIGDEMYQFKQMGCHEILKTGRLILRIKR